MQGDQKGDKPRGEARVLIVAGERHVHCASGHNTRRFCSWKFLPREKGAARHAQARLSFTATALPRVLRLSGWRRSRLQTSASLDVCQLSSAERGDECSAVAVVMSRCKRAGCSRYHTMTLQPARSPAPEPSQVPTTHLRRTTCLPADPRSTMKNLLWCCRCAGSLAAKSRAICCCPWNALQIL